MRVMPRLVLACVAAATVISLAACVSPPMQEARSSSAEARSAPPLAPGRARNLAGVPIELRKFNVQTADGNVIFKLGDLHCAHPSHPTHGTYGDCNGIPVVVLENPLDDSCIAVHPYANLIIHSEEKRKTPVVWQIVAGKPDYEFDTSKDGIAISKVTGTTDPTLPSANYNGKQHQGKKWKWDLHEEAKYPKTFYHLPNVVNKKTGKPCVPIDPGMINVLN